MVPSEHVIALSTALFVIGVVGVLVRRNGLAILMSLELMLAGACLAFVGFDDAAYQREGEAQAAGEATSISVSHSGQVFALLIGCAAAAQVAVGLGLLVALFRNRNTLDVEAANLLRW